MKQVSNWILTSCQMHTITSGRTNKPTNQQANQPTNQEANLATNKQTSNQQTNKQTNQPTNQPINQQTNQQVSCCFTPSQPVRLYKGEPINKETSLAEWTTLLCAVLCCLSWFEPSAAEEERRELVNMAVHMAQHHDFAAIT